MSSRYILLLSFLLICFFTRAQDYLLINFSVNEGLASKEVHDLEFDEYGRLWMATDLGVGYFDGYGFSNLSIGDGLADLPVYEIYKDSRKRLWFISAAGQLTIAENGMLTPYKYNSKIEDFKRGLTSPHSDFYVDEEDKVHIAFNGGGQLIIDSSGTTTERFQTYSDVSIREQIYEKLDDSVFFFSSFKTKPSPVISKIFTTQIKLNSETTFDVEGKTLQLSYQFANYLYVNDILLISLNEDLYGFRGNEMIGKIKFQNPIIKMTQIGDEIWYSTHKSGVIVQKSDSIFTNSYHHIFDGEIITEVLEDINGGIWISTVESGIYHIPNKSFKHYSTSNILEDNNISAIDVDANKIYCGNSKRELQIIEKGKLLNTILLPFETQSYVKGIVKSKKGLLTLCQNKITVTNLEGKSSFLLCPELPNADPKCNSKKMFKSSNGEILLVGNYLLKLEEDFEAKTILGKDSIGGPYLAIAEETNGQYWLGNASGLLFFDGQKTECLGKDNDLLSSQISTLSKLNRQWLLIGTLGRGLILFDCFQKNAIQISQKIFAHGIRINDVRIVSETECWIASQSGLYLLKFKLKDIANPTVRRYSNLDGLSSIRISQIAYREDTLFLATDNGIIVIPKNELLGVGKPPKLIIEWVEINGNATSLGELTSLKFDQNRISIKFKGIDIKSKGFLEYEYRLIGSDENWHSTRERTINYNGLPDGEYRFEIKVINNDGVASEKAYIIPFIIHPPIWKTWWFILIESIFFIGLISFVFYRRGVAIKENAELEIRLNKEKSDMEMLALRAQMNPHFIFNTFNSIQYLIHSGQNEKAEYFLEKFSRLLRRIVDHGMELNIKLIDEIDMLRTYIDLQNLRFDGKFDFSLIIDDDILLEKTKLPGMIIQPFIENALEHGLLNKDGQGKIELTIEKINDIIRIKVKDNGVGREKAKQMKRSSGVKKNSIGLENVAKRIELLQGPDRHNYINIYDLKDEVGNPTGTEVVIELSENTL